jgi:hypothetical protein
MTINQGDALACDPHLFSIVNKKALSKALSVRKVKKFVTKSRYHEFLPILIALLIARVALY